MTYRDTRCLCVTSVLPQGQLIFQETRKDSSLGRRSLQHSVQCRYCFCVMFSHCDHLTLSDLCNSVSALVWGLKLHLSILSIVNIHYFLKQCGSAEVVEHINR